MTNLQTFWMVFGDILVALWFGLTMIAATLGFWAVAFPSSFVRFNQRLSLWISFEESSHKNNKSVTIERPFYRYHIFTGLILIISSIFVLYEVVFNLNIGEIEGALVTGSNIENIWIGVFVDAAFGWIYISGVLALAIGVLVVIRPSYLKGIEQRMNYWVETDKYSDSLDKSNQILDEWVSTHPRIFGIICLLGSVIVGWSILNLGYFA
jgi:hypothetical protein